MPIGTIHKLDKIVLPSSVEFNVLKNQRWTAGIETTLQRPAGHPHPMFAATLSQKPVLGFSTTKLGVLLGAIGVGGASFGSISTFFKKFGVVAADARAGGTHKKIAIPSSCGYWTSLRLPHNGIGEAEVVITAVYDGTNNPFVYSGSQNLSGNLAAGTFFGAGPVAINGTAVPGVQEISIESGIKLVQAGAASEVWDTYVGIEETNPRVTIRTLEMVNWATLGLAGIAEFDGTNGLVCYARKFAPNLDRVADGTAEHVKFIGLRGRAIPVETAGQGSEPISDQLVVELISGTDSLLPLTGTVNSTIT